MIYIVIGIIIIITFIIVGVFACKETKERREFNYAKLKLGYENPDGSGLYIGKLGWVIDLKRNKIGIFNGTINLTEYSLSDITNCELIGVRDIRDRKKGETGGFVLTVLTVESIASGFWMRTTTGFGKNVKRLGIRLALGGSKPVEYEFILNDIGCREGSDQFMLYLHILVPKYMLLKTLVERNLASRTAKNGGDNQKSIIKFHCDACGQKIRVASKNSGKKGKCPKCKKIVQVPNVATMSSVDGQESLSSKLMGKKCSLCFRLTEDAMDKSSSGAAVCVDCKKILKLN